jgi:HK97 family phage major capsid protein
MADELTRYIERRANNWEGMKVLLEASKTRDLTGEEEAEWERRESEIDADGKTIDRIERAIKLEGLSQKKTDELTGREMGKKELTEDEKYERAFNEYLVRGQNNLSPESRATLQTRAATDPQSLTNADGGYTVPGLPGPDDRDAEVLRWA